MRHELEKKMEDIIIELSSQRNQSQVPIMVDPTNLVNEFNALLDRVERAMSMDINMVKYDQDNEWYLKTPPLAGYKERLKS